METNILTWHSVADNDMPEEHQDVIVYYFGNKNGKHFPDLKFMKQSSFFNGEFECDEEVTDWAKMPDSPTHNIIPKAIFSEYTVCVNKSHLNSVSTAGFCSICQKPYIDTTVLEDEEIKDRIFKEWAISRFKGSLFPWNAVQLQDFDINDLIDFGYYVRNVIDFNVDRSIPIEIRDFLHKLRFAEHPEIKKISIELFIKYCRKDKEQTTCMIPECDNDVVISGVCDEHYKEWK